MEHAVEIPSRPSRRKQWRRHQRKRPPIPTQWPRRIVHDVSWYDNTNVVVVDAAMGVVSSYVLCWHTGHQVELGEDCDRAFVVFVVVVVVVVVSWGDVIVVGNGTWGMT